MDLGLNLTGANKVVIFDPDWNPCLDLQAQDRSFRIGQQRFVEGFRFLSGGTVEEHMYLRQLYKQQLMKISIDQVKTTRRLNDEELVGIERFFVLDKKRMGNTLDQSANKGGSEDQANAGASSSSSSSSSANNIRGTVEVPMDYSI